MGADTGSDAARLCGRLMQLLRGESPPPKDRNMRTLARACRVLEDEDPLVRPRDSSGLPGGFLHLRHDIPTIIVPDLHARMDFLLSVLGWSPAPEEPAPDQTVLELAREPNIAGVKDSSGNSVLDRFAAQRVREKWRWPPGAPPPGWHG